MNDATRKMNRQRIQTAVAMLENGESIYDICCDNPPILKMREGGMTLLHHAIVRGKREAVDELLSLSNADEALGGTIAPFDNVPAEFVGKNTVQLAELMATTHSTTAEKDKYQAIRDAILVEQGRVGQPRLMSAVAGAPVYGDTPGDMHRRLEAIDWTLNKYPQYLDAPENGVPPLCMAAWKGQTRIVEHLLERGANPFSVTERGEFEGLTARQITEKQSALSKSRGSPMMKEYKEILPLLEDAEEQWEAAGKPKKSFVAAEEKRDVAREIGGRAP